MGKKRGPYKKHPKKREIKLRALSLGAGVQSTTMLLMVLHGEFDPAPDCAIFADVGWEPKAVYKHLDWLEEKAKEKNFPIYRVSAGNLKQDLLDCLSGKRKRIANPPFYVVGEDSTVGMVRRSCTDAYKIRPINRKIRELIGIQRAHKDTLIEQWIGISRDEIIRMKTSREPWVKNVYPLIDRGMSRDDCLEWLKSHGYSTPHKSACLGCPYHSNLSWQEMKKNSPEEWKETVELDSALRSSPQSLPGTTGKIFLHRTAEPLGTADLTIRKRGRPRKYDHLLLDECEGMCGV
jgi:hypothetical protein